MILVVDNGSSYTSSLIDCLDTSGILHDVRHWCDASPKSYTHCILSGRRRNDNLMNAANGRIIREALQTSTPLLGICYGAEMMALVSGGTIRRMRETRRGEEEIHIIQKNPLCSGVASVHESHSYEIARIPAQMAPVASSASCRYEMIQHKGMLAFGVQFHPEMTADGQEMIRRFARL